MIKELFIEESSLGIMMTQKVLDNKPYGELTRWEKIRTYLFVSFAKWVVVFITMVLPTLLMLSIIRIFAFYIPNINPESGSSINEIFALIGIHDVTWWKFMLVDMLLFYIIFSFMAIPFRIIRVISSLIYYRKHL